ncbi:MAG: alpha-L-rhamnosidase C-terminal domain-containing protein [Prevotella sp.]
MVMKSKATWIWYPGDFEIWLGNRFNNRRTERGAMFPPFWKQDSHWVTVEFSKKICLEKTETIEIKTEGDFNFMLDGKLQFGMPESFVIPEGEHMLNIKVYNQTTPPALYIQGDTIFTDSSWLATYEDKIWIDENGVAHGSGIYVPAASWNFDNADALPSKFRLERKELCPTTKEDISCKEADKESNAGGISPTTNTLYDFGKETFGYLKFKNVKGCGIIHIYYGESKEEALDVRHCETLDLLNISGETISGSKANFVDTNGTILLANSKAFRYIFIVTEGSVEFGDVAMDYEYSKQDREEYGSFRCNDDRINHIWDIAAYTMDLTTREFFVDGIKRDRWTWSGDAIQSYLMNYYLRFDTECVKRTIRQLRGKDPVTAHINTIMDYTFYWFKSIHDYYMYTADIDFLREIYPRMRTMMDYVQQRTNEDCLAEGKDDDWIFVDWVDFPMHKRGILCFEQILLLKSLETMKTCADILRDNPMKNAPQGSITTEEYSTDKEKYSMLENLLKSKLKPLFWNSDKQAFMHAIEDGKINEQITKFPNMFAIIYDIVNENDKQTILKSVMLNPDIEEITTPYMRFYELEALCQMGLQQQVLDEILSYWGGMVDNGATSFWEKYNPQDKGAEHLTMYGRPYGKSLCHAWGASPIYLLGKYFLGIAPTKPGYEEYVVKPETGGLEWMEGSVPTPFGTIHLHVDTHSVKIKSDGGKGTLIYKGNRYIIPTGKELSIDLQN